MKEAINTLCAIVFFVGAVWTIVAYVYLLFTNKEFLLYLRSMYSFLIWVRLAWPGFLMMVVGGIGLEDGD